MTDSSTRTCRGCDGPMPESAHFNAKFCTTECKAKFRTEYMKDYKQNRPDHSGRTCEWLECSNIIPSSDGRVKFCSDECAGVERKRQVREYQQRPETKKKIAERTSTPEYKAKRREYESRRVRPEGWLEKERKRTREYHRRPDVMARTAEFRKTEEYKQRERDRSIRRNATPERQSYMSEYRLRPYALERYLQYKKSERGQEVIARANDKRRAVKKSAFVLDVSRAEIAERDGYRCYMCGVSADEKTGHMDHLIPYSKGGRHEPNNVALACERCNLSKCDKITPEAIQKRGQNMMDSLLEALQQK